MQSGNCVQLCCCLICKFIDILTHCYPLLLLTRCYPFSTFIPLSKKGDLKQCANYRTIALVSHASKILLRIILERIRVKTETEIADEQAGFQQGRGTRDQITNLRILMHKAREHQQPLKVAVCVLVVLEVLMAAVQSI